MWHDSSEFRVDLKAVPNVEAQKSPTAQGTLSKTPWPHLLVYALERRLSGSFVLTTAGVAQAVVVMTKGFPWKLRIDPSSSLAAGAENPSDVGALEANVERVFDLPAESSYAFFADHDLLEEDEGKAVDPLAAMWRGIQRRPSWEHVDATLAKVGGRSVRLSRKAQLERFGFGDAEAGVLARLAEPCRVLDLETDRKMPPRRAELLVYCLTITRQVDLVDAPAPASESSCPPPAGQAFARVQLAKSMSRGPLVIEEAPVPRSPTDSRISSPMPGPIPLPSRPESSLPPPDAAVPLPPLPPILTPATEPPPPKAVALSSEHAALKQKILERARAISGQDYFQMLGLDRTADVETVQKLFVGLAKVWHPDRLPPALASVKDECAKVFSHLTEAHATLSDPERRARYMKLLDDGGATPDDQAKIQSIIEAATAFQKAEVFLKRNDTAQAYEHALLARRLDPDQSDYQAMLAWLEAQRPDCSAKDKTLEKIAVLDRCVQKSPNSERAVFWRGLLYKRIDDGANAVRDFRRAAELNPRNLDAVREVRVHEMRAGAKPAGPPVKPTPKEAPSGGILGKLFKK